MSTGSEEIVVYVFVFFVLIVDELQKAGVKHAEQAEKGSCLSVSQA